MLIMQLSIARDLYKMMIVPISIKGRLRRSIILRIHDGFYVSKTDRNACVYKIRESRNR